MPALKVKHRPDPHYALNGVPKYHDEEAFSSVTSYCMNPDKAAFVGGFGVNPNQAAYEMERLAQAFGHDEGLHVRHWILSFDPKELKHYRKQVNFILRNIAWYAASYYAQQYQIIYAIHTDTQCPHIHFVMSTTNFVTGGKYPGTKEDYYAYQRYLKDFLQQYGMTLKVFSDHET